MYVYIPTIYTLCYGRIATIGSMRGQDDDEDSGEEGQAFYTGGSEHGG